MARVAVLACALISLAQVGCPESQKTPERAARSVCATRGAQCELSSGGLGVCNDTPCPAGKDPPCLKCVSQH